MVRLLLAELSLATGLSCPWPQEHPLVQNRGANVLQSIAPISEDQSMCAQKLKKDNLSLGAGKRREKRERSCPHGDT